MKQQILDIISALGANATLWFVVGLVFSYLSNSGVSRWILAHRDPSQPFWRAFRKFHGFVDTIDPKVFILALALPVLSGCIPLKPAQTPTRLELATMAVNLTDQALAEAIEAEPGKNWDAKVEAVVAAANAVRTAGEICDALPGLQLVAASIRCEKCFDAISTAKEALECPN